MFRFLHHHVVSPFSYRRLQGFCHENVVFFIKYFCILKKLCMFSSSHCISIHLLRWQGSCHAPPFTTDCLASASPYNHCAHLVLCLILWFCVLPICVLCVTRNLVLPGRSVGRIAHTFNISLWGRSCRLGLHLIIHNCLLTFPTSRCQEG